MNIKFKHSHTGQVLTSISRAWWLSRALEMLDGRIAVARINTIDENGVEYLTGLTEEDLEQHGIEPGEFSIPYIIDGGRPKTNNIEYPMSQKRYKKIMDDLQNEM